MTGRHGPLMDRLMAKVFENDSGCWVFTAALRSGYGVVGSAGKMLYAHRVTYEFFIHSIPEGLDLDHLCRNRACCNPWHVEPVSHRENILRGDAPAAVQARQTHCLHGHPFDETNTHITPLGRRHCRACDAAYQKSRRAQIASQKRALRATEVSS